MSEWWRKKRKKRKRRSDPWSDIFKDFDRIEKMMEEMMRRAFQTPSRKARAYKPYVYGFSMSLGPDGKPVVREFGNVQPGRFGPQLREEREPLVDIMEKDEEVVVVAELPGVEKKDINLHTTEDSLTISVNTPNRKYRKKLVLPAKVDHEFTRASYKNGVLEVRLKKVKVEAPVKGERIGIE